MLPITTRQHRPPRTVAAAFVAIVTLSLLLSVLGLVATVDVAAAGVREDEASFVEHINASRSSAGRPRLAADPGAADVARAWSRQMASAGRISHNPNLRAEVEAWVTTSWSRLGENVGVGYSVSSLHNAFMASDGHRANILGDYNRVGVGVVREADGEIWVTVVFIKGPALAMGEPFGNFESVSQVPGGLQVGGWAVDPDTIDPIQVHVYVDSWGANLGLAAGERADVGSAFPGSGSAHGFSGFVPAAPGPHNVCAYAINVSGGSNRQIGCKYVVVHREPFGAFDAASQAPGGVTVSGWAIDPETASAIDVHVYLDAWGVNLGPAGSERLDVARAFNGYGAAHGYSTVIATPPGWHHVCAYGINVGSGANRQLGCKGIYVNQEPFGAFDLATPSGGELRVAGWAIDPETAAPIEVHVYVDGGGTNLGLSSVERPDVAAYFAGYGPQHGFDRTIALPRDAQRVCAYAVNVGAGANRSLGCKNVPRP